MIRARAAVIVVVLAVSRFAFAQPAPRQPTVEWKKPVSWDFGIIGGRTFSTLSLVSGDPAQSSRREPGWVVGATFGRYDQRRIGLNLGVLVGQQRATELVGPTAKPSTYSLNFVEIPILARLDLGPLHDSRRPLHVFGGIGIGRRFHLTRTVDLQSTPFRWAMYSDAIAGARVDWRHLIIEGEYFYGLTKFTPASGAAGAKHLQSASVVIGYDLKRQRKWIGAGLGWEIELHAGELMGGSIDRGVGTAPPPGIPFTTLGSNQPSRRVPSWFFGDGAALFNQTAAALNPSMTSITPLDPVLVGASSRRRAGPAAGAVFTRPITNRVAAEFRFDVTASTLAISREALDALEASRASFVAAFDDMFAANAFPSPHVTATSAIKDRRDRQVSASAGVIVRLMLNHRVTPYVRGGFGAAIGIGSTEIDLQGKYDFQAGTGLVRQTDAVAIRISSGSSPLGTVGGGILYSVSKRSGLRIDAAGVITRNSLQVSADASPITLSSTNVIVISLLTTPSIQWSTSAVSGGSLSSSLSTPTGTTKFVSFTGAGGEVQASVTVGYWWKF